MVGSKAENSIDDGVAEKHVEDSNGVCVWGESSGCSAVLGDADEKLWRMMGVEAGKDSFLYLMVVYQEAIVAGPEYSEGGVTSVHEPTTPCKLEAWLHILTSIGVC